MIVLDNQKALTNTFQTATFEAEENSRTFLQLAQKCNDFSRNSPKISRTFQDSKSRDNRHINIFMDVKEKKLPGY